MLCRFHRCAGLLLLALAGCNPSLNWREVRSETSPLRMLLPCKPDKATRDVEMGGQTLALDMQGCDAAGATFAVSHVQVADPGQAAALLAGWRSAVLAHLHAAGPSVAPFKPAGSWDLAESVRLQAAGRRADGSAVTVQAVWFARREGTGAHLFHAVVYTERPAPEVAEAFFSALVLQ